MKRAKVFKSGSSQAVRLPKEFAFASKEVEIFQRNNEVVLRKVSNNLAEAFELLIQFPSDCFNKKRKDTPPQKRAAFQIF
jgi:antitoxin VapB